RVGVTAAWDWQRGGRYCRPVYRPLYVYDQDRREMRHDRARFEPVVSPGDRSPFPGDRRRREVIADARRRDRDEAVHEALSVDGPRRGATPRQRDRASEPTVRRLVPPAHKDPPPPPPPQPPP